jgi:hypothetical protein
LPFFGKNLGLTAGAINVGKNGIKLILKEMDKIDKIDWELFRAKNSQKISREEVQLIAELHSKYFNHKFQIPCSCSPKVIQGWIYDLNKYYDRE